MEDFSAEEEEPWYDQQDLEQGERGGQRRGCTLRPSPLLHCPAVSPREGLGRIGAGAPDSEEE